MGFHKRLDTRYQSPHFANPAHPSSSPSFRQDLLGGLFILKNQKSPKEITFR